MENKNAASVPMKIGIASLDAQHEALFECINKFIRLYLKGEPERGEVEKQFAALVDYTVTHFDDEEFFMRSIDNRSPILSELAPYLLRRIFSGYF